MHIVEKPNIVHANFPQIKVNIDKVILIPKILTCKYKSSSLKLRLL